MGWRYWLCVGLSAISTLVLVQLTHPGPAISFCVGVVFGGIGAFVGLVWEAS